MRIPVYEPFLDESEQRSVAKALQEGWISSIGPFVEEFEHRAAVFLGARHALSVCNGTAALHLALLAAGVGKGDEVVVPALTFIATANAVTYTGATPVIADVDPVTWMMDAPAIERQLSSRTRAVIPVHLYGLPADMAGICRLAGERGLTVVEDAAESFGATVDGKMTGTLGEFGCYSFYGNKIITTGEGGLLVTPDPEFHRRAMLLRNHGMDPARRYFHPVVGYNYRMTSLQAAVGVAQLAKVEEILARKRRIAGWYREGLGGMDELGFPPDLPGRENVHWMVSILVPTGRRDALCAHLSADGIDTRPFFPPVHLMPDYADGVSRPVSESLSARGINLPSSPRLEESQVEAVCASIRRFFGRGQR